MNRILKVIKKNVMILTTIINSVKLEIKAIKFNILTIVNGLKR